MLTVQNLSITNIADQRPLLKNCSFTLAGTERLAVIGEEGDGKSALLMAICDPESLEDWAEVSGRVSLSGERIGYLPQEAPTNWGDLSVDRLCRKDKAFSATNPAALSALCRRLQLDPELCQRETPFGLLSGGERVRLRLLLLLCREPTLLVLDEPGNDLDLDALETLERFLLACNLPVLYVSHDETLLSRTATQVLHLESIHGRVEPRWTWAKVSYADYVANRRNALDRQEDQWQQERREKRARDERFRKIEDAVAHAQANISRRDPHGGRLLKKKMKAVKSLEHRFAREDSEGTERPWEEFPMFAVFHDIQPIPAGKGVIDLNLPALEVDGRILARDVQLRVRGPEKVLIIGPNGCGKTTLLREIERRLQNERSLRSALMPQRYEELLDNEKTPVELLHTDGTKEQLTYIRTALGAMKLTQDEIQHPIRGLSGGQKAKVLLLRLMLAKPDVLLADEPTRNLSPLSAPVMRELLTTFPGAVICVTHDRVLMEDWPGRVLRLTENGLVRV